MFRPSLFWTAEERGQRGEGPSARFRFSERMTSNTMSLLEITGLTHAFGGQPLFQNAAFALHRGEHVGVVGRNGAGKSTLLKLCTGQLVPDGGRIVWQGGIRVGCLDQYAALNPEHTMGEVLHGAFRALYALERAMTELYDRAAAGDGAALAAAARRQEELEARGFYEVDTRVEKAAAGLGLAELGLDRPVGELSGGQRAKLLLARLLLEEPDVLLLDEPTNFLDQEQAAWLADTLTGLERAFLAVSHDAAFLNRAVTAVCAVEGRRLTKYPGNYAAYQAKKECLEGERLRQYTAQQREIARTEAYIRKNRAGRNAKMARGRQKKLDRLERLAAPEGRSAPPVFEFQPLPAGRTGDLEVVGLSVGYRSPVLEGLDLSVHAGQKVVLTGFNGVGKSTLLNTLAGRLPPLAGRFRFSEQAALGYFPQALAWTDGTRTPEELVTGAFPALDRQEARRALARCGVRQEHALQAVATLSGGEQARVKLCLLTLRPCNFLLLDEPTNHLDGAAKESLARALDRFPGTVLLVSHEADFYRAWAQRVVEIGGKGR